ncbi:hypothetical protein [Bradyrhizobium elkanii]|jgi:hypothetical protein|uniref:hypothetical protein n=1 Tax=Bradyrhizobium elkanii TaxID=29448 RepID=UPI00272AE582|nr:hypothetical protein [Bradyrhizobium elkanii]WLA80336.1 hypothetical protein QNJ99_33865 [Bradyrhizobium elkanii]
MKVKQSLSDEDLEAIEASAPRRVKLFNFDKPRRKFGRLEMDNNRLHGAEIKPDGDAT